LLRFSGSDLYRNTDQRQLHARARFSVGFFFASGVFSGMGAFFTELFPAEIRGNAQGFCYNFGRGLAAGFPLLVGLLSARPPLGQAIGIYAAGAYLLMVIAALALPETRGKNLREIG
jgi:hypothetical protein